MHFTERRLTVSKTRHKRNMHALLRWISHIVSTKA